MRCTALVLSLSYAGRMFNLRASLSPVFCAVLAAASAGSAAQTGGPTWTFAVSGDSRNCGDFVVPAIAAKVKAEKDAFYWHLGDFRAINGVDQDWQSMQPGGLKLQPAEVKLLMPEYLKRAWDDFIEHQIAAFGDFPVFLGRGNHETITPMTREGYIAKFSSYLSRPEIVAQRESHGTASNPLQPWYHWVENGVDFINLDNSSYDEFSDAQLRWLRAVLDRDLKPGSGIRAIVAGMHEALPHSTASVHAMDDWPLGELTGELVYTWFYDAQAAGMHVYVIASHSHYFSPNIYYTAFWRQRTNTVVPGWIIGAAGAYRYKLPNEADKASKTDVYGYMEGTVHEDGAIDFKLREVTENDMIQAKWPNAPLDKIELCYSDNSSNRETPNLPPALSQPN